MEQRQQPKRQNVLSEKVIDKIKESAQGTRVSENPSELVVDSLTRIINRYFEESSARELVQFSNHIQKNFTYLTLSEVELAFELAITGYIDADYQPKTITFKYLQVVLKRYSGISYNIKYPSQSNASYTPEMRYKRLCRFVNFYKMMDRGFTDGVEIIDWLIETKQMSAPDDWNQHPYGNKYKASIGILEYWMELQYPGVMIYDRDTNNPYNKGIKAGTGNISSRIESLKQSLTV